LEKVYFDPFIIVLISALPLAFVLCWFTWRKCGHFCRRFRALLFAINGNKICYRIVTDIDYWCDKCFM